MYDYKLNKTDEIITPALVYYIGLIKENTEKTIEIAGSAERLWPHVKTHKSIDMIKLQLEYGIDKFKCSQIAELEMVCMANAKKAIYAMAPSGPSIKRLSNIMKAYPKTEIFALVDNVSEVERYSSFAKENDINFKLLMDVNMGQNRTGVLTERAYESYKEFAKFEGIELCGMHCYDGNRHETPLDERQKMVDADVSYVLEVREKLIKDGYKVENMIMGGTPSFPCHSKYKEDGMYYSPGTCFVNDYCYMRDFPDLGLTPAGIILVRCISHPTDNRFTIDCGTKAIASEMPITERMLVLGVKHARQVIHSEEHAVFEMEAGFENERPNVGDILYVIPNHVCPCAALYPELLIAKDGEIIDAWEVTARNRKINY